MLTLLGLKSWFENSVEFLSFNRYLVLQRCRQNLVVFVREKVDLLFVALLNLFNLLILFLLHVDHYLLVVILLLTGPLLFLFQIFYQLLNLLSFFTGNVLVFIVQNIWCRLLNWKFSSHPTTIAFVIILLEEHRTVWMRSVPREVGLFALVRINGPPANRRFMGHFWLWPIDVRRTTTAQKQPII